MKHIISRWLWPECQCGLVAFLATQPDSSRVRYDEQQCEYLFECEIEEERVSWPFLFCFICGGRLKRGNIPQFHEESQDEVEEIRSVTISAKSVNEVTAALGKPDEVICGLNEKRGSIGIVVRKLGYYRRWKTLVLWVDEFTDGRVAFAWGAKPTAFDDGLARRWWRCRAGLAWLGRWLKAT